MAPEAEFLAQPFDADGRAANALIDMLTDSAITEVAVVVAWTRYRGLARIREPLAEFRARGGVATIIVGIDEGGATAPGLKAACNAFDHAYIFHDDVQRTFHPKVYLGIGDTKAVLLVGSSNLTPGGLFTNYEASTRLTFELPTEKDEQALTGAQTYIATLMGHDSNCVPLTEDLVDELVADGRYSVAAIESRQRRTSASASDQDAREDADTADPDAAEPTPRRFGTVPGLAGIPGLTDDDRRELASLEGATDEGQPDQDADEDSSAGGGAAPAPSGTAPGPPPTTPAGAGTITYSWSKVLSASDAQQPPKGTPTGNLRLAQARHAIDHRTWFRHTLFGGATWTPHTDTNGNPTERATVPFQVTIGGQGLGTIDLVVDHAPHREEGQNNVTTVLHWGDLGADLRQTPRTGQTLTISARSDGTFQLDIS